MFGTENSNHNRDQRTRMPGDDIAERLLAFAARALQVLSTLPASTAGKHLARQLTRSATSGGANYEEARCAESRADFAHKALVAAKEVSESAYWVRLIHQSRLSLSTDLLPLVGEGRELVAILKASARTARARGGC
jgi:four helix bundle protein